MISMIFSYILLGISLSAPAHPNVAQINKGIKMVLSAWLVGVGAMSADVVMMFLIYFGISTYLTTQLPSSAFGFWFCNDDLFRL